MLNFDERLGPDFGAEAPTYPEPGVPTWFTDAKLGFFIHLGLYSVPAWALTGDESVPVEHAYAHHRYAEWYGNTVRIEGSPTRRRHEQVYGVGTSYEDFADLWDASGFDAERLIAEIVGAGAQYVIPTTKHHEGFCLWDTTTTSFNAARRGPRRDIIQELHDATRAAGVRFGTYFSGALDWHVSDFPPIQSDRELFLFRRNDETFARYCTAQVDELIERFRPDVLWNDIEWPDAGKGSEDFGLAALFRRYLDAVPEGVLNDRWGVPYHGFATREYRRIPAKLDHPWEATRGLGLSFGYNRDETDEDSMSGAELVQLLVDVVAKNGNLLINVGPRADGTIPDVQRAAMRELGAWLSVHGEAVYGTRPWGPGVLGEQRLVEKDGAVYVHLLDGDRLELPDALRGRAVSWLGSRATGEQRPAELADLPVAVARLAP
ncbi:alpha-L-fucosidase [uncultured Tessaracoccus sp.]|uniref:alpha-L-fucosidase n=1 Tax=uncultured Tessaracoccus sp. TaxID=905023 RepID=UPI0025E6D5FC|nr:alpha-L-fucosidase [uncultured Tessaracoccus sp.]